MKKTAHKAMAIVGVGAVMPEAANASIFWKNIKEGRYSITDVRPERWDPELYYDPDPKAPDKSYSKIGGWVHEFEWNPLNWKLPIPPRVGDAMDLTQKWAIIAAREALQDFGYPERDLNAERTAVILGNAMGGDRHLLTASRILFPEYADELANAPSFLSLSQGMRKKILDDLQNGIGKRFPDITEDTMPGELSNIIAGRIAALYNFHGPNYAVDAACASAMAAMNAAVEGLEEYDFDVAITGGIDANMSPSSYVKFCKIGALSATGTRPYADGADGFVMGEGAAVFVLKRLEDAEQNGDKIYAVIRGFGGSSDGKGKGITAPNPVGQQLAVERAWHNAGLSPRTVSMVEGHGTSTRVGDVVEVECLNGVFGKNGLPQNSIALGSVKSNIGHLKGAAGAAGIFKTAFALHEKVIPPSLNFEKPNPNIDFSASPFYVNTKLKAWDVNAGEIRRAGVSAFGFGGTNFHAVLEEYIPGRIQYEKSTTVAVAETDFGKPTQVSVKSPLRGALVLGDTSMQNISERLQVIAKEAANGKMPPPAPPMEKDLRAPIRLAIDFGDAEELAQKSTKALKALQASQPGMWKALRARGIYLGQGAAPKVAFLYTGQGSQYVNMLKILRETEPVAADTFAEADQVMKSILGKPLTEYIFVNESDREHVARAENDLRQTAITQPAVLTTDLALTRLFAAYGITSDMVMGHSLGEYGALVAAGAISFGNALKSVSARGAEMTKVTVQDKGAMAAVFGPLQEVERILKGIEGYVVIANINSHSQSVIGGTTEAVQKATDAFQQAGFTVRQLPVSHAFHTEIVAPASEPLGRVLEQMNLQPPAIPVIANVTGDFYPMSHNAVPEMIDLLSRQVASPVQFIKGLDKLYEAGARVFVEVGPKRALHGFAEDVLGAKDDVLCLSSNQQRSGDIASFNQALCGLYASGLGMGAIEHVVAGSSSGSEEDIERDTSYSPPEMGKGSVYSTNDTQKPIPKATPQRTLWQNKAQAQYPPVSTQTFEAGSDRYTELGKLFADFLERGFQIYSGGQPAAAQATGYSCITGAALGLPGLERVFDDTNIARILNGQQFIDVIPNKLRQAMVDKNIVRLVKSEKGEPRFETISSTSDAIKLAGRGADLDLVAEFGFPPERIPALDRVTALAIAAGIDALRDAGIPLVMHYKTTTKGTKLPDRWLLPVEMRDDTGVIFASAFPGYDSYADEMIKYYAYRARVERLQDLESLRQKMGSSDPDSNGAILEIDRRIQELRVQIEKDPYHFDRRFLFRVLAMGHSQFAEYIGARGPNTQINAACASTAQAVSIADDWIKAGRCKRVVVISADDITTDNLMGWFGAGFVATGAAATDENVEDAALPFDRRRHGMIIGMGGAALVVESPDSARERGIQPIAEVLATITANSAFHGTRLDVDHICKVMEKLVTQAESKWGIDRHHIAPQTVFVSHETYTPARGGSAAAEVNALRQVFGQSASQIVMANTKGFTGHAMATGIEDVLAIKAIETSIVPPVPNFKEVDPELGQLNLSKGGIYPVQYALRLGAGFGSQISMSLVRWVPTADGKHCAPNQLGFDYRVVERQVWKNWLSRVSGYSDPEIEVDHRTLRIKDQGAPGSVAAAQAVAAPDTVAVPAPPAPPRQVTQTPTLAPAPATATAAATETDGVKEKVLEVIAEKTGYPPDMLDLELDLEADLGIDTVKQAETFAAVRAAYDIPRDDNLQLRDFPTIESVIQFVYDKRPDLQTVAAAQEQAAAPATATETDGVKEKVLEVIAEKTGYPPDMLDLELDLEADLGIDTVKQAETFAAVRAAYDIPRDDNLQLRDFPTIESVIQFVYDKRPDLQTVAAAPAAAVSNQAATASALKIPRRVPTPFLRPALDLCKETGVALDAQARVVVMPDKGGVGRALLTRLEKRGVQTLVLDDAPDAEALVEQLDGWLAEGPIHGVYWLPALDEEGEITDLGQTGFREAARVRVKLLYTTMRTLYNHVGKAGTFLVSATRLGGKHGYDDAGALAPLGGAVCGFTKAFKREKADALVKVVDFERARKTAAFADLLIDETLKDPGAIEIGYQNGGRWTIGLLEKPLPEGENGIKFDKDAVFVITGAAGSITSAITADLAAASGGTFYLLDLAPKPDPQNADLTRFSTDRENLKRDIFERLKASNARVTPVMVEKEMATLERMASAQAAIDAVQAAGGTAHYYCVNLLDHKAVAKAIAEVRKNSGRIDALLHAGGLEISRSLPDKSPDEFNLVFDVKTEGWHNLLSAIGDMPLGAAVVFSSIAGRFGNAGQSDYSAANDFLCKSISHFRRSRRDTLGIAIDWTAWADIGMAARGSIPAIMNAAGIDMLPPDIGIPIIRNELTAGYTGELVVAGSLGILTQEFDATGGLQVSENGTLDGKLEAPGVMVGKIVGMGLHSGLTVEATLDPQQQPFLYNHRIGGTAVLPGVMGLEALASVARLLFPSMHIAAIENVDFHAPFKFYRDEPRAVTVHVHFSQEPTPTPSKEGNKKSTPGSTADSDDIIADCRLIGSRTLHGRDEPEVTLHFSGQVRLTTASPEAFKSAAPAKPDGKVVISDDIYRLYFHGPAYQVLEKSWRDGEQMVGLFAEKLPANHEPDSLPLYVHPRLIELCFQTAGIMEMSSTAKMGLPFRIERVAFHNAPKKPNGRLHAIVSAGKNSDFDAQVVDEKGNAYLSLHGYRTMEMPGAIDAELLKPLQEIAG